MPPGQSLVVAQRWPDDDPPAQMFGSTLPSSHSSPASTVPLPHLLGSVVVVVFAGQSVGRALQVPCGLHVSVKRSLSTRFALPLPVEMPVSVMTALRGLFFFFPLSLTMKL